MTSSRSRASTSRWCKWAVVALVLAWFGSTPAEAGGKKRVVVLEFEGEKAEKFHDAVVKLIKKSHTVIATDKWNGTAEEMSASTINEKNVKKVAKKLKIDAVVEGKVEKRRDEYIIRIKLRSGSSGEVVGSPVNTKAEGTKLDGDAQQNIKDELITPINDLESNAGGGSGDDEEKPKKSAKKDKEDDEEKPKKSAKKDKEDDEEKPKKSAKKDKEDDEEKPKKSGFGRKDKDKEEDEEKPKKSAKKDKDKEEDEEKPKKSGFGRKDKDDEKKGGEAVAKKDKDEDKPKKSSKKDGDDEEKPKKSSKNDEVAMKKDSKKSKKDGDEEDKPKKGKDKDVAKKDGEEGGEVEAEVDTNVKMAAAPLAPANRALDGVVGLSFNARRLSFTADADLGPPAGGKGSPPGYKMSIPVAGAMIDLTAYPLAFGHSNKSITKDIGINVFFDRVLIINSKDPMNADMKLATSMQRFAFGGVFRYPLGKGADAPVVGGMLRYGRQNFTIEHTGANNPDIPNVNYTIIEPSGFFKYPMSPQITINAGLGFMLIPGSGQIQNDDQYGSASVLGFEGELGGDYAIGKAMFVRAALKVESIGFKFKGTGALSTNRDGDVAQDVSGARDTYFGGAVTVGYLY
jgi:hypothetical protein